jgi:seryl-tRNA synthetase
MSKVQEKLFRALEDQDQERAESTQIVQRLQMEKAEEMTKLRKALADNESLSCEAKKLQVEASQLQQQLESFNSAMQGQVAWNDIQSALYQAHGDLVAAATQFWRNVEAIQNRQLATYLPGSGVVDAAWTGQVSAQGPVVPTSLPEISGLGEYSILPQQAATSADQNPRIALK